MITLNFNLREPKGNKCTNVYCVVRYGSVQLKFPIGCKVNSWQWDKKKQIPKIDSHASEKEKMNNTMVLNKISSIRFAFLNNFIYLCKKPNLINRDQIIKHIKKVINIENMDSNKQSRKPIRATEVLKEALEKYYREIKTTAKESAKKSQQSYLNAFVKYCKEINKDDMTMLSQSGLNKYRKYLIDKQIESEKNGAKRYGNNTSINAKCEVIERLINKVISTDNCKIAKVSYQKLEETTAEGGEKKRRPLKDKEIEMLLNCDRLSPEEKEYRDLFVLECYCAYRIGDTAKLFDKKQQNRYEINDYEFIVINTQKECIDAVIWATDKVKEILERYEHGFQYVKELGSRNYIDKFNRTIKKIAKKAGLDSTETYKDSHNKAQEQPLYKIISSHFGRYTFIYNGLFKFGYTPDELKDFTGHADDKMINDVYAIYTQEDKVKKVIKAIERVQNKTVEVSSSRAKITRNNINEQDDIITEVKEALYCLGADYNELVDVNDYHKLNEMLYCDYHNKYREMGCNMAYIKDLYISKDILTLKEKRELIQQVINEVKKQTDYIKDMEELASEALE